MSSDKKMFRTGLLVVTRPLSVLQSQVPQILAKAKDMVLCTLYVHLQPGESASSPANGPKSSQLYPKLLTVASNPLAHAAVVQTYQSGARVCSNLDVRVLLSHFTSLSSNKPKPLSPPKYRYSFKENCEVVLVDQLISSEDQNVFLKDLAELFPLDPNARLHCLQMDNVNMSDSEVSSKDNSVDSDLEAYQHAVMGGTFDRLHAGHKILLSDACMRCTESVTVGVTDGEMNKKKTLCELIAPVEQRILELLGFLGEIKPRLSYTVVPILDPFGPSTVDPRLQCIVVSQETLRGGRMVNEERQRKGLSVLDVHCIELIEDAHHSPEEEAKISSSSTRKRLLGTLLRPVEPKPGLPCRPYRIGLTGGIASGKSSICRRLEKLGAVVIDCDKLGHKVYIKGTAAFDKLVSVFGTGIIGEDGEINRKALGAIVFSEQAQLSKLNEIVWPEIAKLAEEQIQEQTKGGAVIVVLDAAVLLEAGWQTMVHEVWTTVVPRQEAVRRMQERNNLSEAEAVKRISSQMTSEARVKQSHVVLSTLWEYEVTQKQVEKAWRLLEDRILSSTDKSQL